jgi:hypothetical protein
MEKPANDGWIMESWSGGFCFPFGEKLQLLIRSMELGEKNTCTLSEIFDRTKC